MAERMNARSGYQVFIDKAVDDVGNGRKSNTRGWMRAIFDF